MNLLATSAYLLPSGIVAPGDALIEACGRGRRPPVAPRLNAIISPAILQRNRDEQQMNNQQINI